MQALQRRCVEPTGSALRHARWGVVHNGKVAFPWAVETLTRLKELRTYVQLGSRDCPAEGPIVFNRCLGHLRKELVPRLSSGLSTARDRGPA